RTDGDFATIAYDQGGHRLWVERLGLSGSGAFDIAVGPDGSRVYVTGVTGLSQSGDLADYATVAYDAASGAQLWFSRYDSGAGYDSADTIAVSPDGTRIYVTGYTTQPDDPLAHDYTTVAYDATSGSQLWATTFN